MRGVCLEEQLQASLRQKEKTKQKHGELREIENIQEQNCSDLRTALISALKNTDIIRKCGEHAVVQIYFELSESRILRTDGRQQKRASVD